MPRPDRFRRGDHWTGPNGRVYVVRGLRTMHEHVCLAPLIGGPHVLMRCDSVRGFRRVKWGGKP
jgi:hypothetical protein